MSYHTNIIRKLAAALLAIALLAIATMPAAAQGGSPETVVNSFYTWYLGAVGYDEASGEFHNPLVEGTYQERPELSPELIEKVAAIREEEGGYQYDPFLCAQDIPVSFEVEPADQPTGQDAVVLVREYFGWNPRPNLLVVSLHAIDGTWRIANVNCQETITPRGVTESFYAWYLDQVPAGESLDEPYPLLTDALNERVQQARRERQLGDGDPILCAQDIPVSVAVDTVSAGDEQATMLVREFFAGNPQPKVLSAELILTGEQWSINDIQCQPAPEVIAELLYNEYLTFMRYDMANSIDRTPIKDWTPYPWAQYMGESLLDELLAQYSSGELIPADPFLCAQDLPEMITVEQADNSGDNVTLRIMGAYPSGPDTFTTYELALAEMAPAPTGEWQMIALSCAR